jgi:hypothetical protein
MVSYDTNARIGDILNGIEQIIARVDRLIEVVKPQNDLWDNSDILRNWHISERTLAGWRAKEKITYIQVGKKIFYTKQDRDRFIEKYHINLKRDELGKRN